MPLVIDVRNPTLASEVKLHSVLISTLNGVLVRSALQARYPPGERASVLIAYESSTGLSPSRTEKFLPLPGINSGRPACN